MKADFNDEKLIQVIQEAVEVKEIEIDGQTFTTRTVFDPPAPKRADPLVIHTLQGIVDYIANDAKLDGVRDEAAIHVLSESRVEVIGPLNERFRQRETLVRANSESILGSTFVFGRYYGTEDFIIALRSVFAQPDVADELVAIVASIDDSQVNQFDDDGLTQTVTARIGAATRANRNMPTVVELIPFRTFREIDQPASEFFMRLKSGQREGAGPTVALFETDGGKWKLEAIEAIKTFLTGKVNDVPIIA